MSCRETFLSKPVQDFDERRERAAIRIQAQARGNATRKFVKQREHGADEWKERAAIRIQTQARGNATRKREKSPTSTPSPSSPPFPPSPPSPPSSPSLCHVADEGRERAAILIQAHARGHATRKRVKTLRLQWLDGIGWGQVRWSFCISTIVHLIHF